MSAYVTEGRVRLVSFNEFEDFVVSDKPVLTPPPAAAEPNQALPPTSLDPQNVFEAVQELGTALRKERAQNQLLQGEVEKLRSQNQQIIQYQRHKTVEHELKENQSASEKTRLLEQLSLLQADVHRLNTEVRQVSLKGTEDQEKLRFEQDLQRTAQEFSRSRLLQLQQLVDDSNIQLSRLRNENERLSRALRENELRLRTDSRTAEVQQQSLLKKLAELTAELGELRPLRAQYEGFRNHAQSAQQELARVKHEFTRLHSSAQKQTPRISELEAQLESERNEKHMILATLRTNEIKLSRAENRISDLEIDLERLREAPRREFTRAPSAPANYIIAYPDEET